MAGRRRASYLFYIENTCLNALAELNFNNSSDTGELPEWPILVFYSQKNHCSQVYVWDHLTPKIPVCMRIPTIIRAYW